MELGKELPQNAGHVKTRQQFPLDLFYLRAVWPTKKKTKILVNGQQRFRIVFTANGKREIRVFVFLKKLVHR